jgi:hypothetical protein
MNKIQWQFGQRPRDTTEDEKNAEEFFNNADILTEAASVVRESIQNSLDEVLDKSIPVRMVFTLGEQSAACARRYFGDLSPHLAESNLRELPNLADVSRFLTIEDFNTRGLEGPTTSENPPENVSQLTEPFKHSFWFFEWKSGGSNKSSGNRGSWGIGKVVFPRASRIKTYLVYSVRRPQAAPGGDTSILFGRSILRYRTIGDVRYLPDARWMTTNEHNSLIPSSDVEVQAEFARDWKLLRTPEDTGTSIVIPFCREELTADDLAKSIILEYFIPILAGKLECTVRAVNDDRIVIDKSTIYKLIDSLSGDMQSRSGRTSLELKQLCELFASHESDVTIDFEIKIGEGRPLDWSSVQIAESEVAMLLEHYNSGAVIRITIETAVPRMTNPPKPAELDHFVVLMKRAHDLRSSTVFCREGILIPSANTSSNLQNCVSMVLVGDMSGAGLADNSLANLLKFAEGPAHERWSTSATHFRGQYKPQSHAEAVLRWVKLSAERCLRMILGAEDVEDDTTLSDYFPVNPDDEGIQPDLPKITLIGHRNPQNLSQALFKWSIHRISAEKCELRQIEPAPTVIYTLSVDATTCTATLDDDSKFYKFQMVMTEGEKEYRSNIVVFGPLDAGDDRPQIQIVRTATGFAIRTRQDKPLPPNYNFVVTAAYKTRGSTSLRNWSPEDFLLEDKIKSSSMQGLTVRGSVGNSTSFSAKGGMIYAEWSDFDPLRDIIVEVRKDSM